MLVGRGSTMVMKILYIKVVHMAMKVVRVVINYLCFVCVNVSYQAIVKQML